MNYCDSLCYLGSFPFFHMSSPSLRQLWRDHTIIHPTSTVLGSRGSFLEGMQVGINGYKYRSVSIILYIYIYYSCIVYILYIVCIYI